MTEYGAYCILGSFGGKEMDRIEQGSFIFQFKMFSFSQIDSINILKNEILIIHETFESEWN